MNFIDAIKTCFVKYVDFTGRAARSEFWYWELFSFIASLATAVLSQQLNAAFSIATLIPSIAVGARRLHDIDRSGWWLLLVFIPVIGWIVLIIWQVRPSDPSPNRFGAPPLMTPI